MLAQFNRKYRKYLLANRIFMSLLPSEYCSVLWGSGTWGGRYSHFSRYPLGVLCWPCDQASTCVLLQFILTVVEDTLFYLFKCLVLRKGICKSFGPYGLAEF